MKMHTAIHVLGGTHTSAAQQLGCTRQAVDKWVVDGAGKIKSHHVVNAVLAALVRQNYQHHINPMLPRHVLDEETLIDLMD